jgi:outer membrane protein TolC
MTNPNPNPNTRGPVFAFAMLMIALAVMLLAGCTVGPDYKRPDLELPKDYGVVQAPVPAPQKWWAVFNDPVLDRLVDEALVASYDLKAAAARIEQARGRFIIERAALTPDVGVSGSLSRDRASAVGAAQIPSDFLETKTHRLVLRAAWELDFWGKYRRATEAAQAELLATEAGRDAVRATLIGDVIRGYFALEALDRRLAVAERTLLGTREGPRAAEAALRLGRGFRARVPPGRIGSSRRAGARAGAAAGAAAPGGRARPAARPHTRRGV